MLATVLAGSSDLANTAPHGAMPWAWLIPVLASVALLSWLALTVEASSRKVNPSRRNDQDNHRGGEQGGYYVYTPGIYSHSYPPGEAKYNDEPS
ncbi:MULTISPECIES: hypothetical protein [Actinomadura]|uniref:Uncharacterized protein n=1 Tax=Actinomadura litoris TaxID=2678616 RepID=A0A7K1LCA7_9ACTN|nr:MULTISPECIES: hypothetical protein [Actinomadura]MBT2208214.1 hypothetical protein [Actinomadura sp. NEAU-AAG7]MUN42054.1 hypothetical protein [Actinomadura litoris]